MEQVEAICLETAHRSNDAPTDDRLDNARCVAKPYNKTHGRLTDDPPPFSFTIYLPTEPR